MSIVTVVLGIIAFLALAALGVLLWAIRQFGDAFRKGFMRK